MREKLNVLQINSSRTWAGGETHLFDLLKGLSYRGHNITLIVREEIADRFDNLNIDIINLPLKNSVDLISVYQIKKIIKEKKIDVIHSHLGKDYWLAVMASCLAKQGKVVCTRHILVPLGKSRLHHKLYNYVDKFVAVSKEVKKTLIVENQIPVNLIMLFYNGIDMQKYSMKGLKNNYLLDEFAISKQNLVVGMVGTLCDRKNQALLIKVAKELGNRNIKYILVGEDFSSQKKYREKLESLILSLGLSDKVFLTGFRSDIAQLMSLFDILVVPSRREAFGLVAIEAMAMKKPVIASKVGGLKEIVIDQVTGLLVPTDSKLKLKKSIFQLLNNSSIRNKMGLKGYERVKKKFCLGIMSEQIEKLYYDLI